MAKVSRHDIALAALDMLKHQSANQVATSLAAYLVTERRTRELTALMRDLERIRYNSSSTLEVTAVSARELSAATRQAIINLWPSAKIQLHTEIRPDLVGGVYVRTLDQQLDLSVRHKLQQLKNLTVKAT